MNNTQDAAGQVLGAAIGSPVRVQLSRKRGWKMPSNTVKVSRPGKWGNPFRVGVDGGAAECVKKYEERFFAPSHRLLAHNIQIAVRDLRGKNLACWCPLDQPCHADVLLRLANNQAQRPALGGKE